MGSILQTTLNTRALPIGNLRYVRSDYPGKLTDDEVKWLRKNNITTIVDLREEKEYKTRQCLLEKLDIKATPLPNGLVKVKTGANTDDTVYNGWYSAVYQSPTSEPTDQGQG